MLLLMNKKPAITVGADQEHEKQAAQEAGGQPGSPIDRLIRSPTRENHHPRPGNPNGMNLRRRVMQPLQDEMLRSNETRW